MAPARKLFLTHAGELAHLLYSATARNGSVMRFIRAYASRHGREKLLISPERLREIEMTIGREALLLMSAEVQRLLPATFGLPARPRPEQLQLSEIFYGEFLQALGRAAGWPADLSGAEEQSFYKDLEIYSRWSAGNSNPAKGSRLKDGAPFPDRCAILLDPAMMEQGRRAAREFQQELLRLASRTLGQLGRTNVPQPRPRRRAKSTPSRSKTGTRNLRPARNTKGTHSRRGTRPGVSHRDKAAK